MLTLYRLATRAAGPFLKLLLRRRLARGKEDAARLGERMGHAGRPRPPGRLLWVHAASIGESLSALPLLREMLARESGLHALVTTGTVTSARLMAEKLPAIGDGRAFHQFAPLDHPSHVARFLDHWRPDAAAWVESELWPNMILQTRARGVPMALVNGRMGDASYAGWKRWPAAARRLMGCFGAVYAQSGEDARRFRDLGAPHAVCLGNLKYDAAPLDADSEALEALRRMIGGRPVWLAASTHAGEEEAIGRVHAGLREVHRGLLTLIVPRHERRGDAVAAGLRAQGLAVAQRSRGEAIAATTDVYLADTTGELGIFYRLAPVVFVGGTLVPHGGQNPLEAARLGGALLAGPHMFNFREVAARLEAAGGLLRAEGEAELGATVGRLLRDAARRESAASAARGVVEEEAGVTKRLADALQGVFS